MSAEIAPAVAEMRDFSGPWGIGGGWAIDLFLGYQSRAHADIDIALLRADQPRLRALVAGRVQQVVAGCLVDWLPNQRLELPVHEIHVAWPDGHQREFLLNEHDDATKDWVFRRDPRIRRALAATFCAGPVAPYLAPEIVLLYKAKSLTPKDTADFEAVVPRLDPGQSAWLRRALAQTTVGHPWLTSPHLL